jgi:glycine cleavage system H protein
MEHGHRNAVEAGKAFGVVESVKAVSDVYAPLTGTIEEINDDLIDAPEIINTSPYEDGWMVKIRMAEASDADELMDAEAYQALIAEES